jgi:hypothetical protein
VRQKPYPPPLIAIKSMQRALLAGIGDTKGS